MSFDYYIEKADVLVTDIEAQLEGISEYRKNAVNSHKLECDKRLSLAATLLLNRALAAYGLIEREMEYAKGEYGKPYFKNHSNIHFSISHSGEYCVVAVSSKEIGIDIQEIRSTDLRLAERFFTAEECKKIKGTDDFFKMWSIKESFIKAIGKGLACPLNSFNVRDFESKPFVIYENKKYLFTLIDLSGYKIAVCTEE